MKGSFSNRRQGYGSLFSIHAKMFLLESSIADQFNIVADLLREFLWAVIVVRIRLIML